MANFELRTQNLELRVPDADTGIPRTSGFQFFVQSFQF